MLNKQRSKASQLLKNLLFLCLEISRRQVEIVAVLKISDYCDKPVGKILSAIRSNTKETFK